MENMTANMYVISNLTFLDPESTVYDAYERMKRDQIHHIPVVENGEAIGIISDRDLQFVTLSGNSQEIKCKDIMTEKPLSVSTSEPLADVAKTMIDKKVNSVLINNTEGKVVGIFTSTDALKILANQLI
ncbi:CBS domain-containing protein [Bacteriovorax sp. DB6_IX]|uniref:CBS domain-containing protein n=1 Tax=Bacteriovorax sp. DB6_IX TaxID=1353530 RepID=UPI00038A0A2C|nr:CBS domain-containing protein [Bacteriovorax sp. DB6_IX]EQC52125.1 CBS domain protein [Bacteriovorax sp. DB6_IX]